jgi:hypothetical protein
MMPRSPIVPIVLSLALLGCPGSDAPGGEGSAAEHAEPEDPATLDVEGIAAVVVERLDLQPGERVLLVGLPGWFDDLVPLLRRGVREAGAVDLGAWAEEGSQPEAWRTDFTASLAAAGDALMDPLRTVDASVMLPGATPEHAVYGAIQDVLGEGRGRTVHFHWSGAYWMDGTLREPGPAVDAFYQRALAETDYEALAAAQASFEEAIRGATIRVTTPAGTDIAFRVGDRPVTRQDGDASAARAQAARTLIDREVELPAGAVRVAPLEQTVEGHIVFPPGYWGGELVEGLSLTFEEGAVTEIAAESNVAAVTAEMDAQGPAARAFRELALGFNPLLAIPTDGEAWIPYYGYGAGVVRLSLGDNTELGGAVSGGYVRWNFFTDATVTVDGDVWVEDGRLVR